jgi:uncharacterized protein YbjT (DUF2867 family)/uncharacterized protein YndB with AHSA1/START domain
MAGSRTPLVSGATGYVGGRLIQRLVETGQRPRALARDPSRVAGRPWADSVDVVKGDVLRYDSLIPALQGTSTAFYLVHSMHIGRGFRERDTQGAINFARAASAAGVDRIVYLGGLAPPRGKLSPHMGSRLEVGLALRTYGTPVTEFRAGIIVGSGSASFEMIRYLTERMPVMICPAWTHNPTQPICIRNVVDYLVAALEFPAGAPPIIEIGGPDVLTYADMLRGYARIRGLRRLIVPLPLFSPAFCAFMVGMITPVPSAVARPLIESMRHEVTVHDEAARTLFPHIQLIGYEKSLDLALRHLEAQDVKTRWSDALASNVRTGKPAAFTMHEGVIIERRTVRVPAPPESVFRAFTGLGGGRGWLYADWTWRLRGYLDRLIGGVGLGRGRRDPDHLRPGDVLDFWRVERIEEGRTLLLRLEARNPGRMWLSFEVEQTGRDESTLNQVIYFAPKGLVGMLYWHTLYPLHRRIFSGLVHSLARRAVSLSRMHPEWASPRRSASEP